jgi:hypothetical protein
MTHWGDSFSQGVRLLRIIDHDGREQVLSIRTGEAGWTTRRIATDGSTEDVTLRRRELRIGRDRAADLVFKDPTVAGQHCRIYERRGNLELIDRGSANGTYINGRRCTEPTALADGDRIELGRSLIEVLAGRSQIDVSKIGERITHRPQVSAASDDEIDRAFYADLQRHARAWSQRRRPRAGLLRAERLERAADLRRRIDFDEPLRELMDHSVRADRRAQTARWTLAGALPGLLVAAALARPIFPASAAAPEVATAPQRPQPGPIDPTTRETPATRGAPCKELEHEILSFDTLEALAAYYRVERGELCERNPSAMTREGQLVPGAILKICSTAPLWRRESIVHTFREGDTIESIAHRYGAAAAELRTQLPASGIPVGERLALIVPRQERRLTDDPHAQLQLPEDAVSEGAPQSGGVHGSVKVHGDATFKTRCPVHSYASAHTYQALDAAIRRLRSAYDGDVMIADLSLAEGGGYGRHVSHQSGRDVDIWLPILGGVYRSGCPPHCGNTWCRPESHEVDWPAAWLLISALIDGGAVEKIFLDRSLMPLLKAGAERHGAEPAVLDRLIRPRGATVIHSDNHTHHIHVRFRCAPGEAQCTKRARGKSGPPR